MDYRKITDLLKQKNIYSSHTPKKSSVFLPIIKVNNKPSLLFQVRSFELNTQPGEICFPGGRLEESETPLDSAVRETIEELNIHEDKIKILGSLEPIITTFDMIIYPFVGSIDNIDINNINFNKEEVNSIFTVPLDYLLTQEPLVHKVKFKALPDKNFPYHLIQQGKTYKWRTNDYYVYFYQYKNYIIWGITAKILKNFIDIIKSQ